VIVLDTSVLYAASDRSDHHHERCREWIATATDALLIPPTVLAESCYLIVGPWERRQKPRSSRTWA